MADESKQASCYQCGATDVPLTDEGAESRCWPGCRKRVSDARPVGSEIVTWLHGLEQGVRNIVANRVPCGPEERAQMRERLGVYEGVANDVRRKWPALFAEVAQPRPAAPPPSTVTFPALPINEDDQRLVDRLVADSIPKGTRPLRASEAKPWRPGVGDRVMRRVRHERGTVVTIDEWDTFPVGVRWDGDPEDTNYAMRVAELEPERRSAEAPPDPWAWTCPDCGQELDQSDKSTHPEKCSGTRSASASHDDAAKGLDDHALAGMFEYLASAIDRGASPVADEDVNRNVREARNRARWLRERAERGSASAQSGLDPEHCETCAAFVERNAPPAPKVEVKSELWDAAKLKMRQLEGEIQRCSATQREKSNMLHSFSKLCMFATDAWDMEVTRPANRRSSKASLAIDSYVRGWCREPNGDLRIGRVIDPGEGPTALVDWFTGPDRRMATWFPKNALRIIEGELRTEGAQRNPCDGHGPNWSCSWCVPGEDVCPKHPATGNEETPNASKDGAK